MRLHPQAVLHELDQSADHELRRRHVDPHDEGQVRVLPAPGGQLAARFGEDPASHVHHQAGLLGHRDEGGCREEAARRVLPAHQGLDGQQLARAQVDFGLVVQAQPVALDGLAEGELGARALADRFAQHLVEHHGLVASLPLGGVQRHVGPPEQLDPVLHARLGEDDADAGGVAHLLAGEVDGLADDPEDPVGGRGHFHLAGHIAHQDHELVAPETGGEVVRADAGADPVRDGGQDPVTAGVAQEVVHDLEAVQVEEEDRRLAVGGQADLQLPEQGAAVGQPGQVVVEGDVLGPFLGVDAGLELDQHGGDRLQGTDLLGGPGVEPEVEEAQDAPGGVGQEEGHAGAPDPLGPRCPS